MAQPILVSKSDKIVYGSSDKFSFSIKFLTAQMLVAGSGIDVNKPVAGTLTIAGSTVTLGNEDIVNVAAVAKKIANSTITGFTVYYDQRKDPFTVTLINALVGPQTKPTIALGNAKNIIFYDMTYVPGVAFPTVGSLDDLDIGNRVPLTFTIEFTGGTCPDLMFSNGTPEDQASGALTYGSAVTLVTVDGLASSYTLTSPMRYAQIQTQTGNTQAIVKING
jgi:hypothetical protein